MNSHVEDELGGPKHTVEAEKSVAQRRVGFTRRSCIKILRD